MAQQSIGPTIQNWLNAVKAEVNALPVPPVVVPPGHPWAPVGIFSGPVQVPNFDQLMSAAGNLDTCQNPAQCMTMINTLLARASSVDFAVPSAPLSFPADHHLHPGMGLEWYWFGCHLNVVDRSSGKAGRLGVLVEIQRNRCVGLTQQSQAGWSDEQITVVNSVATVTVDMGPQQRTIIRRTPNNQWPMRGGVVSFSKPGQPFSFVCGADKLTGSEHVLPLNLVIDDGSNMQIQLSFTSLPQITDPEKAFFLQGAPDLTGSGTGLTPVPTPGIYYSWPHVQVSGTVTVVGKTYDVQSGSGWIDHQLMMTSLQNPNGAAEPVPFLQDARPYNGWVWQFFNCNDMTSLTGAGFILGEMTDTPNMSYGYYVQPNGDGWKSIFVNGNISLLWPNAFPIPAGANPPFAEVVIPIVRGYSSVANLFDLPLLFEPLSGVATPWHHDGTFNLPNGSLCGESPADYTDLSSHHANGLGFLESVGLEDVETSRKFSLQFLARNA